MTSFSGFEKTWKILLCDESADLKHPLTTVSNVAQYFYHKRYEKLTSRRNEMTLEFVLAENNYHVQARNILLIEILSSNTNVPGSSCITKAFTSILYNMNLDEESFFILQSTLKR